MLPKRALLLKITLPFVFLTVLSACNSTDKTAETSRSRTYESIPESFELSPSSSKKKWQPTQKNTIPVVMNSSVQNMVDQFNTRYRKSFERWIMRIGMYGPTIEKVLEEEGAPRDLIYLSMIESGFNLGAESHAAAVGPWQFIQSTGKMYGLKNDLFMDDRRHLIQATQAAARHLKDLYKMYGDWYLAFAAYNAGPGTVNRAIKRTGSKNYWKHRHTNYLRAETKQYVPKILAALHIVKNYKKYGYTMDSFGEPLPYDVAVVDGATDINAIAFSADTSPKTIATLNPHLMSGVTRPNQKTLVLIPEGSKDTFNSRYSRLPESKKVSHLMHKTQKSDSMKSVAEFYGISTSELARYNGLRTNSSLRAGRELKIPASKAVLDHLVKKPFYKSRSSSKYYASNYKVRRGDTLSRIASKNKTSVSNLKKWNRLRSNSILRVGQNIKIYKRSTRSRVEATERTFYAANFSPESWKAPQLLASAPKKSSRKSSPPKPRGKMSGVSHIIFQDEVASGATEEENPVQDNENFDITQITAEETQYAYKDAEAPGKIKTGEEEAQALENELVAEQAKAKAAKTNSPSYYTVKSGDSLSQIAQQNRMSVAQLKKINRLASNQIHVNQKLKLKASPAQPQYHVVKAGENLSVIAQKYKMSVAQLKQKNGLNSDFIKLGQKLKVTGDAKTSPRVAYKYHTVRSGENLSLIAQKYRMDVGTLKSLNKLTSNTLRVSQKLRLNSQTPFVQSHNSRPEFFTHQIRNGDTLWGIAKKYSVTVADLKKWNRLTSNDLRSNQKIKIYN